jgi:hypothetical protein
VSDDGLELCSVAAAAAAVVVVDLDDVGIALSAAELGRRA